MSRVVKNNRGFLQLLAHCPIHQCEFLLRTATPQQVHALVQVLYSVLKEYIPFPEENRQKLLTYKDALISLAEPNVSLQEEKAFSCARGWWIYSRLREGTFLIGGVGRGILEIFFQIHFPDSINA